MSGIQFCGCLIAIGAYSFLGQLYELLAVKKKLWKELIR